MVIRRHDSDSRWPKRAACELLTVMLNPTLNRTCNSVRRPGFISFRPGRRTLPHAG